MSTGANLLAVSLTPSPRVRSSDDWAKRGTMGQCTCTEVAGPQNLKQTEDSGCDTSVQICRSQISFRERRGNRQKRSTTFWRGRERAVVNLADIRTVSKAMLRGLLRDEVERIGLGTVFV